MARRTPRQPARCLRYVLESEPQAIANGKIYLMESNYICTKNNLGLVCITTTDDVRFKTITRKRLLTFDEKTQAETLRNLYKENLERLEKAIDFCLANEINLYRMSSKLFPFADDEMGKEILTEFAEI